MVNALTCRSSGLILSLNRGYCVVSLGKNLYYDSLGVTLRWTSVPSRESTNTPSRTVF